MLLGFGHRVPLVFFPLHNLDGLYADQTPRPDKQLPLKIINHIIFFAALLTSLNLIKYNLLAGRTFLFFLLLFYFLNDLLCGQ